MTHVDHGRCRSGRNWFWYAAVLDYDYPRCDDSVCEPGLHPHEYGWEDTEDLALKAMAEAVSRLGGEVRQGCYQGNAPGRASAAAAALKRINSARRKARPPKPGAAETTLVEYLYEPWSWSDYDNYPYETSKGINEIPILRKTAKRIYYDASDSWDRQYGVVTQGYIDRQDFEADTRCRGACPVDVTVTRCSSHRLSYPHCVHVYGFTGRWKARYEAHRESCADRCPLDTTAVECARHGYTWEHCPHGSKPGDCQRGYPAGAADLPGRHYGRGGTVYATREAAEEYLYRWEGEQERKRKEAGPELKRLRMAMADAHPDRGGTNEEFIAAREAYKRALRQAS